MGILGGRLKKVWGEGSVLSLTWVCWKSTVENEEGDLVPEIG